MRFVFLLFSVLSFSYQCFSQTFSYKDYANYTDKLFLNTPNAYLRAAKRAIANNNYDFALISLNKAAELGLFNIQLIKNDKTLQKFNDHKAFGEVLQKIEKNRNLLKDTTKIRISTSDIDLFWQTYEDSYLKSTGEGWMNNYIMKGTVGLRTYFDIRIGSETNLLNKINNYKIFYSSIKAETGKVKKYIPEIRRSLVGLKEIYDDAFFPPVYIVIGNFISGGTTDGGAGLLIGIEFEAKIDSSKLMELNSWERSVMKPMSEVPAIIIHELIHDQQKYEDQSNSLLAQSITEGVCDFITFLLYGKCSNEQIREYGDTHEKELWLQFKGQMSGNDISKWLYNSNSSKDRPADLGYYMGMKIAESYYYKAGNKKQAIKDMLKIKDFKKFLADNKYEENFK